MTRIQDAERALPRLLAAMSRPRVVIEVDEGGGDAGTAVRVLRPCGDSADVVHVAPGAVWELAITRGYAAATAGRWGLTEAGRRSLADLRGRSETGDGGRHEEPAPSPRGQSGADAAQSQPGGKPLVNIAESPLAWLARRRDRNGVPMISAVQFEAGERLRLDHERAALTPRVTTNWDAAGAGVSRSRGAAHAAIELRDSAVAARERVNRALTAVGPELGDTLLNVCCHLKGLEQIERDANWPQRSAKVVLQMALSALARHYGIAREGDTGGRSRIGHWGASDYRPRIDGTDG